MSQFHYFGPNRGPLDYDVDENYYIRNQCHNLNPNHYYYFYSNSIMPSLSYTYSSSSSSSSHSSSSPASLLPYFNPDPFCIPLSTWAVAEEAAKQVIARVHPTHDADQKRKDVTDYLQTLVRSATGAQLFPYGSVPLKTYLPDGDIDLTALSSTKTADVLANDVRAVLEKRQQGKAGQYEIHDVQFIDAEVKLVKCLVQNIVVDISFNQLGGICTLCFLEQVDRLIGKDHLFKRSIILVKAWCYYESRILGAHHGLISTYALETLVLYIFNMFHSSIDGPISVLYRFLDYFSKFDWDNYCISLNGPVPRAALADVLMDIPDNGWNNVLLSAEFLKNCVDMFSVPSKDPETNMRAFTMKHLNIIDPLKLNNNLGRSVHRGNFYRIRSALRYGARELGWILSLPGDRLSDELKRFFSNSLEMHGSKYWDGIPIPLFPFGPEDPRTSPFATTSSEGNSIVENEFSLTGGDSDDELNKTYPEFIATGGAYSISDGSIATFDTYSSSLSPDHSYSPKESGMNDNGHQDRDVNLAVERKGGSVLPKGDVLAFIHSNPEYGFPGDSEESNSLLDLTGEYECHIRSLLYGLNCHGYALSATPATVPFKPLSHLGNRYECESINHSSQFKQSGLSPRKASGFASTRVPHQLSHYSASSFAGVRSADKQNVRGTGTFIPNINHPRASEALQSDSLSSGNSTPILNVMASNETDHWFSEEHFPALPEVKSGFRPSSDSSVGIPFDKLEFGSFKRGQSLGILSEKSKQKTSDPIQASGQEYSLDVVEDGAGSSCKSVSNDKLISVAEQVLVLEDAVEFPPLSI
ncbi:hypothetical protein QQ045_017930 [Rhodiola kirilowii]